MSSEVRAKLDGLGPVCDRCETLLQFHGALLTGQACDFELALNDFRRALGMYKAVEWLSRVISAARHKRHAVTGW